MSLVPIMPPWIGLSIEGKSVAYVERQRAGWRTQSPRLRHVAERALPEGLVTPNSHTPNISDVTALSREIAALVNKSGHRGVALTLADRCAHIALLEFQQVPSEKAELEVLIRWRLAKDQHLPPVPWRIAYRIFWMEETDRACRTQPARILVTAVREEIVAQYEAACEAAGLLPIAIHITSLQLLDLCRQNDAASAHHLYTTSVSGVFSFVAVHHGCPVAFRRKDLGAAADTLATELTGTLQWYEDRWRHPSDAGPMVPRPAATMATDGSFTPDMPTHNVRILAQEDVAISWPSTITPWLQAAAALPRTLTGNRLFNLSLARSEWKWAVGIQWGSVSLVLTAWLLAGWCWLEGQVFQQEAERYESATARQEAATSLFAKQMADDGLTMTKEQMDTLDRKLVFAKRLVEKRAFSWVELLHDLEKALPAHVSIHSIRMNVQDKTVSLVGKVKTVGDLDVLAKRLEEHEAFSTVTLSQHHQEHKSRREAQAATVSTTTEQEGEDVVAAVSFSLTVGYRPVF